jgi:hypothetical protein
MQTASLTAEDFRFTPDLVRVRASAPLTLSLYNAGLAMHEADSPILIYAANLAHMAVETLGFTRGPVCVFGRIRRAYSAEVASATKAGSVSSFAKASEDTRCAFLHCFTAVASCKGK